LTRSQSRRVMLGAALGICWMVGLTVPPWLLSRAVDRGLVAGDTPALIEWALALLAVTVLNALLGIARHRTMTKIRMDASFRSVRATVWHTSRLGASLARRMTAGEVVTVGITDVYTVAQALTITGPGIGAVVAYAVVAVVLFTISPLLAAVVLAGVPLLAIAVGPFLQRIEHTGGAYRAHQGRLTTRLVDVLAGLRVLNGLGGKTVVAERYNNESQRLVGHGYRVAGPSSWVGALSTGLPALFLAAVVWLSARMAATGAITIGDVVAVYGYVAVLVIPVASLIEGGGDLARARVAGQRIIDLLNLPVARDNSGAPIPTGCGPLADPESGVIIRPGLLTALVAARPAEAIAVIERLGQLSSNAVTWYDVPIDELDREEFRRRLVVADNDAEVFAGTVRDVVAGRLEPDDDGIRTALRVAVAEDVVEALSDGLDTAIAAGGTDLSGGQRQRIRLARAVYAKPDVLLAVDPTSALDANTEAAVVDRIREARRDTTTVITTTSPLVLDRADEVIVLVDGKTSSVGTHADLLRSDPYYRDLVSRDE
jgi:ABC-type bacteriocin/lantibiotic exporter with double-glycine peptidase domain